MRVLADTSVWSQALRRSQPDAIAKQLAGLILQSRVVLIGPVRQELMSGISDEKFFDFLKSKLQPFEDMPITTKDYETAAAFFNICRQKGVQGSHIDFLICAVAGNNNVLIFSCDKDFQHYAQYLPIQLLKIENGSNP